MHAPSCHPHVTCLSQNPLAIELLITFDVRVFNPFAQSNSHSSIQATYGYHENLKKRYYEKRIRERWNIHPSHLSIVFSTTGSLGPAAGSQVISFNACRQWKQPYSTTMGWLIRCRLSFSIRCLRGARSLAHKFESHLAEKQANCYLSHRADSQKCLASYFINSFLIGSFGEFFLLHVEQ